MKIINEAPTQQSCGVSRAEFDKATLSSPHQDTGYSAKANKRKFILLLTAIILASQKNVFTMQQWKPSEKIRNIVKDWDKKSHCKLIDRLYKSMENEVEIQEERMKTVQDSSLWKEHTYEIDLESIRYCTIAEIIQLRFVAKTEDQKDIIRKRIDAYIKEFEKLENE